MEELQTDTLSDYGKNQNQDTADLQSSKDNENTCAANLLNGCEEIDDPLDLMDHCDNESIGSNSDVWKGSDSEDESFEKDAHGNTEMSKNTNEVQSNTDTSDKEKKQTDHENTKESKLNKDNKTDNNEIDSSNKTLDSNNDHSGNKTPEMEQTSGDISVIESEEQTAAEASEKIDENPSNSEEKTAENAGNDVQNNGEINTPAEENSSLKNTTQEGLFQESCNNVGDKNSPHDNVEEKDLTDKVPKKSPISDNTKEKDSSDNSVQNPETTSTEKGTTDTTTGVVENPTNAASENGETGKNPLSTDTIEKDSLNSKPTEKDSSVPNPSEKDPLSTDTKGKDSLNTETTGKDSSVSNALKKGSLAAGNAPEKDPLATDDTERDPLETTSTDKNNEAADEDDSQMDYTEDDDFDPLLLCPEVSMAVDENPVITSSGRVPSDGNSSPLPYEPVFSTYVDEVTGAEISFNLTAEEQELRKRLYGPTNPVQMSKIHCTACNIHLGSALEGQNNRFVHPLLKVLICKECYHFYTSGEFEKDEDGSELYCRWCGQGGQVLCCSKCEFVFCKRCIKTNFGRKKMFEIRDSDSWDCFRCVPSQIITQRVACYEFFEYVRAEMTRASTLNSPEIWSKDHSLCCTGKKRPLENGEQGVMRKPKKRKGDTDPDYNPLIDNPIVLAGSLPPAPPPSTSTSTQFPTNKGIILPKPLQLIPRANLAKDNDIEFVRHIPAPQIALNPVSKTNVGMPGYRTILPTHIRPVLQPPTLMRINTQQLPPLVTSANRLLGNALQGRCVNPPNMMKHEWFEKTVRAAARVNSHLSYTLTQLNKAQSQAASVEELAVVHNKLQEILSSSINSLIQIRKNLRTEFIAGIKTVRLPSKKADSFANDDDVIFVSAPSTMPIPSTSQGKAITDPIIIIDNPTKPTTVNSTSTNTSENTDKPKGYLKVKSVLELQNVPSECITIPDDVPLPLPQQEGVAEKNQSTLKVPSVCNGVSGSEPNTPSDLQKTPDPKNESTETKSKTLDPSSKTPDPESKTPDPESKTPDPESKTPDPESKTPDPESETPDPNSKTPDPKNKIPDPKSNTPDPKSKTPDPKGKTPDPKTKTPNPKTKTFDPKNKTAPAENKSPKVDATSAKKVKFETKPSVTEQQSVGRTRRNRGENRTAKVYNVNDKPSPDIKRMLSVTVKIARVDLENLKKRLPNGCH